MYRPFDQQEKLGSPPWKGDEPALIAWEKAHGHDVRLKCYPEFGCLAIEAEAYELRRERDEARRRARIAAKALLLLDADLARFQDVFDRQAVEAAWPWVLRWREQIRSALADPQPPEAGPR